MVSNFWLYIYSEYCSAMSCISRPKQPLGWGSPFHRLHMNSLRYSCYLLTINQVLADHRPSVDQLLTDTSVKYRRTIGEVTHLELSTMSQPSVVRLSFKSWPTADWLSTAISTESRLTIDRLLTECRPTIHRVSTAISTTISTDRSVDTTYSKHDPQCPGFQNTKWLGVLYFQ